MRKAKTGAPSLPNPIQILYKYFLKPLFFTLDPETAHRLTVGGLRCLEKAPGALPVLARGLRVEDPRLAVKIGLWTFRNPVGLAAGFDKGAEFFHLLGRFVFGFAVLGTFTPLPQSGQKRPRLFRYPAEKALVNRMGFNNPGVEAAAERIRLKKSAAGLPLGINIGKGRETPLEEAVFDYVTALDHVYAHADYIALNVSSPNTPGLRSLQEMEELEKILAAVTKRARELQGGGAPPKLIFTKVSPDGSDEGLDAIVRLSLKYQTGIIATNTTVDHSREEGGLSGRPLQEKSNRVIQKLYASSKGAVPLIGVGGIFSAEDAYQKIRLGARLVQIYTGWVYEGPDLVRTINQGLLKLMERDGFKNIGEAVGTL